MRVSTISGVYHLLKKPFIFEGGFMNGFVYHVTCLPSSEIEGRQVGRHQKSPETLTFHPLSTIFLLKTKKRRKEEEGGERTAFSEKSWKEGRQVDMVNRGRLA